MNLRRLFGLKPKAPYPDWVRTGAQRWVVIKRKDNVVREALQSEQIDLNTGERRWSPVLEYTPYVTGQLSPQSSWATTRIRTLTEQELAAE